MKKFLYMFVLSCFGLQAQFVELTDNTSINRFLGLDQSTCSITTSDTKNNYQKSYNCNNSTISGLLNLNLLSPELLGQQFYIFNNFMYWIADSDASSSGTSKQAAADANPDEKFSGTGVFMIVVGTSSYLQTIVAPTKTCPAGENLLVGQLKYNNGASIVTWSQDSICLSAQDSFAIAVSKDQDNTVSSANVSGTDSQGVDWMKDAGPSANYQQADSSPRKIRFVLKNSSVSAPVTIQQPISTKSAPAAVQSSLVSST